MRIAVGFLNQLAREISPRFTPSIRIFPLWGSRDFSASLNGVDFPAPVSPVMKVIWVGLGLLPGNHTRTGSVDDLNRIDSSLGAMAQSNADEGPDKGPIASDLKTANHLGKRVVETLAGFQVKLSLLLRLAGSNLPVVF